VGSGYLRLCHRVVTALVKCDIGGEVDDEVVGERRHPADYVEYCRVEMESCVGAGVVSRGHFRRVGNCSMNSALEKVSSRKKQAANVEVI